MEMIRLLLSEAPIRILQRFSQGLSRRCSLLKIILSIRISDIPAPELGIMYNLYQGRGPDLLQYAVCHYAGVCTRGEACIIDIT